MSSPNVTHTLAATVLGTLALLGAGCTASPDPTRTSGDAGHYPIAGTVVEQHDTHA